MRVSTEPYTPPRRQRPLAKRPDSDILAPVDSNRRGIAIQLRSRWIWGPIVLLFVLQMVIPSRAWVALLVGLGGSLGLGYYWARQMSEKMTITREQYYGWAHVGDLLEEQFTLQNGSFLPVLWVEIDDHSTLPGYTARSALIPYPI